MSRSVVLVANLGYGRPPNGQAMKARAILGLLEASGRTVLVVDVGTGIVELRRLLPLVRRGHSLVVVLNRKGLWITLALAALVRRRGRQRAALLVPVVGGWLPSYVAKRRYRWLANIADEYLAETPTMVRQLGEAGLAASELANFRDVPIDSTRVRCAPSSPLRLCFAGRLRADKGLELAAELADRLRQDGIDVVLEVHGPVEEPATLERALTHPGVTYRGVYASPEDAVAVFAEYDLLVLPTSYEGECMPGVVVEAAFAALPALVSDWHDLGEVVIDGESGLVCPLDDFVTDAVTRIGALLLDGGLPGLSRGALELATHRFSEHSARAVLLARLAAHERP